VADRLQSGGQRILGTAPAGSLPPVPLLTGATGAVGAALPARLLAGGTPVRCLGLLAGGTPVRCLGLLAGGTPVRCLVRDPRRLGVTAAPMRVVLGNGHA
jgi:hypothetical protein